MSNDTPLIEGVPISDVFARGWEAVVDSEVVKLVFWDRQGSERIAVLRVVMPVSAYNRMMHPHMN